VGAIKTAPATEDWSCFSGQGLDFEAH
jgi:hypothetical protein